MDCDFNSILSQGKQLSDSGASDEELLSFFRRSQAGMIESVKLIRQIKAISLREAQEVIRNSETWADQRDGHDELQQLFASALLTYGRNGEGDK